MLLPLCDLSPLPPNLRFTAADKIVVSFVSQAFNSPYALPGPISGFFFLQATISPIVKRLHLYGTAAAHEPDDR